MELLSGKFREGDAITVDVEDGKLDFRAEKVAKEVTAESKGGKKAKRSA